MGLRRSHSSQTVADLLLLLLLLLLLVVLFLTDFDTLWEVQSWSYNSALRILRMGAGLLSFHVAADVELDKNESTLSLARKAVK